MPDSSKPTHDQHAVEMYREKQKTIRKAITFGVILIVGLMVIIFGGKLKLSKDEIVIEKNIIESTGQKKENTGIGEFTTGQLNPKAKEYIQENKDKISTAGFTGKNYINNELGYLFSVEHPEKWQISYERDNWDKDGMAVNTIEAGDGIVFKLTAGKNSEHTDIETLANAMYLGLSLYAGNDPSLKPEINFDKATQTAFFNGMNVQNHKRVLMKVILKNDNGYIGYVEYPKEFEGDERVKELKHMVGTLTLI